MNGCRVLVVEDELLVGLDLVWTLEHAGFLYVEHVATETEALNSIRGQTWDVAVVDANLNGRGIEQVALLLWQKKLPFVVVTGYDRGDLPDVVSNAPVLGKPFSHRELVRIVGELCGAPAAA